MVAVIGDVHGCYFTLKSLVEKVRSKYPVISIYCVGDLVDRGDHSLEVLDFIISEKILFTPGNHDLMFYAFFKNPGSMMAKAWIQNGADSTMKSYEKRTEKIDAHLIAIKDAPLFISNDDCFVSHAGISENFKSKLSEDIFSNLADVNNVLMNDLYDKDSILWCRSRLLNIGKLQVVGHTHKREVFYDENSNAVYIDTTAFGMNKLSAVIIENNKVIEVLDQKTFESDSDSRWHYYA